MNNIPMDLEKDFEYFSTIWEFKSKNREFHTEEKWNERAQDWNIELTENPEFVASTNERVQAITSYLKNRGLLTSTDSVIDIGCGPGRFASEFAKSCHDVVATDISPDMLALAEEYAKMQNQTNIDFIVCDFQKVDIDSLGWKKAFDLVFTSITPAISTVECLDKVEQISRGWAFNSSFLSWHDSLEVEIVSSVFGQDLPPQRAHSHWYYALLNLIWLQGYFPVTDYFTHTRNETMQLTDIIIDYYMRIFDGIDISNKRAKLEIFLQSKTNQDVTIQRTTEKVYGWLLWNVNNKMERI